MGNRDWEKVAEFHGEAYKRRQKTTGGGGGFILILILVFLVFLTCNKDASKTKQSDGEKPVAHSASTGSKGAFKEAAEATEALANLLSRLKSLSDVERNEAKLISALQRMHRAKTRVNQIDSDSYKIGRGTLEDYKKRMSAAVERIKISNMKRNWDAQQRVNHLMWQYGP